MMTLRELRLWHWREVLKIRASAENHAGRAGVSKIGSSNRIYFERLARNLHKEANFHLGAVQVLNDSFPADDTAERDAATADKIKTMTAKR